MRSVMIVSAAMAITMPSWAFGMDPSGTDESMLCYETVGCVQDRTIAESEAEQLGCDELWTVRNGIYRARGYCFKTDRAKQAFGNENCTIDDEAQVPLNDYERANVRLIRSIEQRRGCRQPT